MRRLKQFGFVALLYCLLLVLVEGGGQLTIRYLEAKRPTGTFGDQILSHDEPLIGFGLKKNLDVWMGDWRVKTNSLGFRESTEIATPKPKNEIRIFMVGGSTIFGWPHDEERTIPHKIEELIRLRSSRSLASQNKTVRVINAGVPWYASWHEASLMFFRILPLEPDWIIVFDGLNDVAQSLLPTWAPMRLGGFVDPAAQIAAELRYAPSEKRSFFIEILKTSPTFAYFYAKQKAKAQVNTGTYHPEVWDQYIETMEKLSLVTKARGIRFSHFLQPVIVLNKTLVYSEVVMNASNLRLPEFASLFKKVYLEGEKKLHENKNLNFKSLRTIFEDYPDRIYVDGLHYNETGNDMLASAIFDQEISPNLERALLPRANP